MLNISDKTINVLDKSATTLTSDAFSSVKELCEDGKKRPITRDAESQNTIVKDFGTDINMIVDSVNVLASHVKYNVGDDKYETIIKKSKNSLEAIALFKREGDDLDAEAIGNLQNGDNRTGYIDRYQLNHFVNALLRSPIEKYGEKEALVKVDENIASAMRPCMTKKVIVNRETQKEETITVMTVDVTNVEALVKAIQKKLTVDNVEDFTKTMITRMENTNIYNEDKDHMKQSAAKMVEMLHEGTFSQISADTITKIELKDLITINNLVHGTIKVPERSADWKDANRKMFQRFIEKNDVKVQANAVNYVIAGRNDLGVPVFYTSELLKPIKEAEPVMFEKAVKASLAKLQKKNFDVEFVAERGNKEPSLKVAYLRSIKQEIYNSSIYKDKTGLDANAIKAIENEKTQIIAKLQKAVEVCCDSNSHALKTLKEGKQLSAVINMAINEIKGVATNILDVSLIESKERISMTANGKALPASEIYGGGSKMMTFSVNKKISKKNFGDSDDDIKINTGYSPTLLARYEYSKDDDKFLPLSITTFNANFSSVEYLGDIIKELANVESDGKIRYIGKDKETKEDVEKEYTIDVEKSVALFAKGIDRLLVDPNGVELKRSNGVRPAFLSAKNDLLNAQTNGVDLADKIVKIKDAIGNSEYLEVFKVLGESLKKNSGAKESIFYAGMNSSVINAHIERNQSDILSSYPDGDYRLPKSAKTDSEIKISKSKAGRAISGTLAKVEKGAELLKYVNLQDRNKFAKNVFKAAKDGGFYQDLSAEDTESKISSLRAANFVRDVANVMVSKVNGDTRSANFGPIGFVTSAMSAIFYNTKIKELSKDGKELDKTTTTVEAYSNVINKIATNKESALAEISDNISNRMTLLRESAVSVKTNSDFSFLDDIIEGVENIDNDVQSTQSTLDENSEHLNTSVEFDLDALDMNMDDDMNASSELDLKSNSVSADISNTDLSKQMSLLDNMEDLDINIDDLDGGMHV